MSREYCIDKRSSDQTAILSEIKEFFQSHKKSVYIALAATLFSTTAFVGWINGVLADTRKSSNITDLFNTYISPGVYADETGYSDSLTPGETPEPAATSAGFENPVFVEPNDASMSIVENFIADNPEMEIGAVLGQDDHYYYTENYVFELYTNRPFDSYSYLPGREKLLDLGIVVSPLGFIQLQNNEGFNIDSFLSSIEEYSVDSRFEDYYRLNAIVLGPPISQVEKDDGKSVQYFINGVLVYDEVNKTVYQPPLGYQRLGIDPAKLAGFESWRESFVNNELEEYDRAVINELVQDEDFNTDDLVSVAKVYAFLEAIKTNTEIDRAFDVVQKGQVAIDDFLKRHTKSTDFQNGYPLYTLTKDSFLLLPYSSFSGKNAGYGPIDELNPPSQRPIIVGPFDKEEFSDEDIARIAWAAYHERQLHGLQRQSNFYEYFDLWKKGYEGRLFDQQHICMSLVIDMGMLVIKNDLHGLENPLLPHPAAVYFASFMPDWQTEIAQITIHGDYNGEVARKWYEQVVEPAKIRGVDIPAFSVLFDMDEESIRRQITPSGDMFHYSECLDELRAQY